jgi:ubiquinone/menaquinone biosynthesis C-methylase UbiE
VQIDWSDGSYETTGAQLEPAAERALAVAEVRVGERVLDLGCGTGNAALAAARRGADVMAIDPAQRLLDVARARAAQASLRISFAPGHAAAIPAADRSFDAVVAVFSAIFAPDPQAAVTEMCRVVRPGGRLVVTSWVPTGAIHEVSQLISPAAEPRGDSPWTAEGSLYALFSPYTSQVTVAREMLAFAAPSAEAWFEIEERDHPFWRAARSVQADAWMDLRRQAIAVLQAANESPSGFRVTSQYLITRVQLPT